MDEMLAEIQEVFFGEADQILDELEASLMQLEASGYDEATVNKIFRLAHNFKGSSRSVGFTNLADLAHKAEDLLTKLKNKDLEVSSKITSSLLNTADALRNGLQKLKADRHSISDFSILIAELDGYMGGKKKSAEIDMSAGWGLFDEPAPSNPSPTSSSNNHKSVSTASNSSQNTPPTRKADDEAIRIPSSKLDNLLNLIGELVVNQIILQQMTSNGLGNTSKGLQIVNYISKIVSDVQSVSMSLRLVAVKPLFQKLRRAVRDVASEVNKEIDYIEEGDHVELDKTVVDKMVDPLTHMVRNAVDHGVDTKDERIAAGKSPIAKVILSAVSHDDRVVISLSDDGRGLNKARILQKAIEKNIITVAESSKLTADEIHGLIFKPGFSTKEAVSAISGRGVGMEVVQKAIDDLKGTISIDSIEGKGTTFKISLPLSLSIIGGMVVKVHDQSYVIPISQLLETIELSKLQIETSTGRGSMAKLRNEVVPIYSLSGVLRIKRRQTTSHTGKRPALITTYEGKKISFEVDEIIGQQQVVLKKLGQEFEGLPGLMGGAVLSTGDPGLVLNLYDLIKKGHLNAA